MKNVNRIRKTAGHHTLIALVSTLLAMPAANAGLFEDADLAARDNRLADMQRLYEEILQSDPANVRALAGKAAAQSWQGDFDGAKVSYMTAIELAPDNVEARVGLGYSYAWSGDYARAHDAFYAALREDPLNLAARKGIGYAYLWSGEYERALDTFDLARSIAPDDAEIVEASGHASLSLGHARDAIGYYEQTLEIDPQRVSAHAARRAAYTTAPALEVSAQYGSTSDAESGLRAVEIAHWPYLSTRLALRYDNSLSLDNRAIAERGEDAPSYYFSAQHSFSSRWIASLDLGRRELSDGDQNVVGISGAVPISVGVLKLGAQIGRHDLDYTEQLFFGGIAIPLGESWQVEPVLFLSEYGESKDNEWRVVLNTMYQNGSRWNAGLRLGYGDIDAGSDGFSGRSSLVGAWTSFLVSDEITINLSFQHEESPTDEYDIAYLGFTWRMPRN